MTPERWQQIEEVLQAALDRPPGDRASFLENACAGDFELRSETDSLIDALEQAGDFIEEPAIAQDSYVLIGDVIEGKVGHEIGPYTIVERLGGGGMGEVYLARDRRLDRLVALKILPAYFAVEDVRLNRFQREARAASALNHPNILTIHEVGEHDGIPFIAAEFIDGSTLRELIEQNDLSIQEVLEIAEQVASALSEAHAAGIVHRDIKPENIMRRTDGLVKILDFGIAKLIEHQRPRSDVTVQTEVGVVMGTVDYMSPEQARGLSVDERTDIWSLGVVLYEMLARRRPFTGATRMDSMVAILEREPVAIWEVEAERDGPRKALQHIVDKCLHKETTSRHQSATELLSDLRGVRQRLGDNSFADEATRTTFADPPGVYRRGPSWLLIGAALLLVVIVGAFVYQRWGKVRGSDNVAIPTPMKLYSQMNEAEQLAFVSEQEQRISNLLGDRPAKLSDEALWVIKRYVDRYAATNGESKELGDGSLSAVYGRAPPYVPLIARSFAARKVPVIIGIYLPVIESGYRPCFENDFGAKGLFQFLPQTARHYGVAHADMCDVEKMAPAAAQYIADGMAELGEDSESLTLVLLSYNSGPEFVRNTLRELRGTENYQRNFWTLFAHRDELNETFQNENAGYVPAFFAAAIIGENPRTFGLTTPPLSTLAPGQVSSKQ
jgi:serine/threonine protein kinase